MTMRGHLTTPPGSIATDHDDPQDKTPAELRESAYRRGVHHGFYMALEMLQTGYDLRALAKHEQVIHRWRYRQGRFRTSDRAEMVDAPWSARG